MTRNVFFSFHFDRDAWRAGMIRNIGVVEKDTYFYDNEWEKIRYENDEKIKSWINKELDRKTCLVLLIGQETSSRKWVQYEIEQAWKKGKGIVGIYINKLRNNKGLVDKKGTNPLEKFCIDNTLNYIVKREEPWDEHEINLSKVCETYYSKYQTSNCVYNDIKENIESLIERAITIRNRYPK